MDLSQFPPDVRWVLERCRIDGDCYLWQLSKTKGGRPVGRRHKQNVSPQRIVYEQMTGKSLWRSGTKLVPNGGTLVPQREMLKIAMSCGEPSCCNWRHMRPLTHRDLCRDAFRNGTNRGLIASARYTAPNRKKKHVKLTLEKAREIVSRAASGEPILAIAKDLGIRYQHAWSVARGKSWKDANPFGVGALWRI